LLKVHAAMIAASAEPRTTARNNLLMVILLTVRGGKV
jgi:hypothetical protein